MQGAYHRLAAEVLPSPLQIERQHVYVVRRLVQSVQNDGGAAVNDGGCNGLIDDRALPASLEAPAGLSGMWEKWIFGAVFPNFFWSVWKMAAERSESQTAARYTLSSMETANAATGEG